MVFCEMKEGTHVLLVAFSSQGHLNPMLRLAKRLASKGLDVTLATTEVVRERMVISKNINSSTTTTITIAPNTEIHLEYFSDGLPLDYDRKTNLDYYFECLAKFGPQNLSNLIGERKFSCIVNNPFVPWVADVAAQHATPCAMLWIQPSALYAIYYRFYNELSPFETQPEPDTSVEIPGLPLLKYGDLPSFVLPSNPFNSLTKCFTDVFKNMDKLKWVLGNSFYELEKDVVDSMLDLCPIKPIGPLVPSILLGDEESEDVGIDMWKPDETCIKWLDEKPPSSVIYVSFGSIVILSRKQMENLALALKNSKHPFLWVVKPSDYTTKDGEGQLPNGFLEEMEGRGLVVQWCPQIKVLMHPSISCFITHCGWNSMLETVTCGVPVIALPQWTDQPTNAKLIEDVFRIGLKFKADEDGVITREEVERCINEVIDGPNSGEFKKRALELKEASRKAVADGGSSDLNIQNFVHEITGRDCLTVSSKLEDNDQHVV